MTKDKNKIIEDKLDIIIGLLRHLLAIKLSEYGVTQEAIGKYIHVAKSTVNEMLKGIKKDK
jgi:predicted transcriptional regulator